VKESSGLAMHEIDPLPCQRHLFELPDAVCYLDAAAWSPHPLPVSEAGERGMLAKRQPWVFPRVDFSAWAERARAAAAALVGASVDEIAIVGSVSHAIATAARNLSLSRGGRILRVADEFPSQRLAWDRVATEGGLVVETVPRPSDGNWTAALLEAIDRTGAPQLAVATLCPLHWSDGALIDLEALAPAIRAAGAALVVDATQAVGVMPIDVGRLKPDFLAFPTYKWTLGPYGLAFLYAAPHRQDGLPLEENSGNQRPAAGARRYDKGERNDPLLLPMAAVGMELIAGWGAPAIAARLRQLTDQLAEGAEAMGLSALPRISRSPHILGLRRPGGLAPDFIDRVRDKGIFVSDRLGCLRISPHVWANEADIARCLDALLQMRG
jgi:selenocysteine lyase/cysteine desulfurase